MFGGFLLNKKYFQLFINMKEEVKKILDEFNTGKRPTRELLLRARTIHNELYPRSKEAGIGCGACVTRMMKKLTNWYNSYGDK